MNTQTTSKPGMIARVAVNVRLYFDVPVSSDALAEICQAAREELESIALDEQIKIKRLRFPVVYPTDVWPAIKPNDFQVCQVCPASEANIETRFPL